MSAFAAHLAAGAAPARALARSVAEMRPSATSSELVRVVEMVRLGSSGPAALRTLGGRHAELRWLAASWQLTESSGAPLAPVVARLGEAIRAEALHARAVDAELAGVRASARLLGVLPLVGLLMGVALGAEPLRFLLATSPGRGCLLAGVLLEWLGLRWSGAIARTARSAR